MDASTQPTEWALRPARPEDVEPIAELRAVVMRPDLERLGRFDEQRVRQRLRDSLVPQHTWVIEADGAFVGCVALRPAEDGPWLEHFYLDPSVQGRGLGSAVLHSLLERADADGQQVRVNVLHGSAARRLYERHGFTLESEDPIDLWMVRLPATTEGVANLVARLRAAGCVYAEEEAAILLESGADLESLVARRVAGEPLEYVVGWAEFCGLRVAVEPGVFVPRRRTEFLVETAVAAAPGAKLVVDLCCGSGALGLAFADRVPGVELHAADIEPRAVACARRNLPDAQVHQGDLFDALPEELRGRVDVLLANTPYVPTHDLAFLPPEARDHEPAVTLDGGGDGLVPARRVAEEAGDWLAPGGVVLVETSERQAARLSAHFAACGLAPEVAHDDELGATVVVGRR
ncbi:MULTISPECIES: putative protein N(5)-glutamine methyltransferase [unclassified Nocardioides]|uniref:putative protein N(5)-glutamine methyltransferase n=1 Tax=unclassified Nocardioides TaxID=2615069 RepID=UPI0009E666D6|nr:MULTISPECIES: putative protein N(5)-glutamine methyltransferase [unclassified Nocardioides]